MAPVRSRRPLWALPAVALAVPAAVWWGTSTGNAATQVVADDGFDRVAGSLGSAPTGGAWQVVAGAADLRLADSQLGFAGRPGTVLDARLATVNAADVTVTEQFTLPQLPTSGSTMVGVTARYDVRTGRGYRLWANVSANGTAVLHLDRLSATNDVTVGRGVVVPGVVRAGQPVTLRLALTGSFQTNAEGTIWSGGDAPAPQLTVTDMDQQRVATPGAVGIAVVAPQAATPVTVQQFTATALAGDAPAPAPTESKLDRTVPSPSPTATATSTAPAPAPTTTAPAPAPTTAPVRVVAAEGSQAGALPVGQASYPVPSGAIHVSTDGNDQNPGTQAAPKRTIQAGVAAAPSGGTVVLRGGIYHEGETSIFKPVTVQNAPGEAVWLDGSSPVTGFSQSGSTWRAPWNTFFDHSVSFTKGAYDPDFLDPKHPMAAWPDQVFVDGRQLEQVDLAGGVGPGQFAVDQANKQLVLGTDPAGHEVRASDRDRVFTVGSPDVTLRGFGIRRYANALPRLGVIFTARQRDVVENVVIEDVATLGISMTSDGSNGAGSINHVTIRRAGLGGITGMMFDGGRVANSLVADCNTQKFTPFPATGGIKVTRSHGVAFDRNVFTNNYNTTAIWTDESVTDVTVTRNRITNQDSDAFAGIQLELTSRAVVADNVAQGNFRGLYLFDSNGLRVWNNTISDSVVADISVDQDFRRQANPNHNGHDPRSPIPDPDNTWISGDNVINNNLFGSDQAFSNFQFYVLDKDRALTASQMVSEASGNAFEAKDASAPTLIGWGKLDATVAQYNDLQQWSDAVGRGWSNHTYPAGLSVADAARQAGEGRPLDATVANQIGQAAGSTHVGSFQQP